MEKIGASLGVLLVQLPLLLVWLVGLILAIVYWKRHPKVSIFAIIGIVGLGILSITGTLLNMWLPLSLYNRGLPAEQIGLITSVIGIVDSLLAAGLWVLVLLAIFSSRKSPAAAQ